MNYEEMTVKNLFIEENGAYSIDCKAAVWATDKMHEDYPKAIEQLSDGHAHDMSTNIFERLPQVFYDEKPQDTFAYIQILEERIVNGCISISERTM